MGDAGRWIFTLAVCSILLWTLPPARGEDAREWDQWTYHTSGEISSSLERLALDHENAEFTTAQELLGTREVHGGLEVPILFIGDRGDDRREWIMIIGAHHGDEPDSAEAVLAFAHYILGSGDGTVLSSDLMDSINMAVLPVVNPYGLDHGSRYDENGEDPNRDYPFEPEPYGANSDGIPLTTAGAHAVHSLAMMYPISVSLSFHTGSEGIFTPWGADNVRNLTPDQNMFRDLGSVLSEASGRDLDFGPANDFGSLGYLNGAFDDHLYGSSFYSQHLSSVGMALPWSTATATIEMIAKKGRDETRLGNLDGVFFPGSQNDGMVPMGVRMCLAACQLLEPEVDGEVSLQNGDLKVDLTFTGGTSPSVSDITINRKGAKIATFAPSVDKHPFLPEYYIRGGTSVPEPHEGCEIRLGISHDADWNDHEATSDPGIAPLSLFSLSRRGADYIELTWSIEGPRSEEMDRLRITAITPSLQQAGNNATITIDVPPSLGEPLHMDISARVDWNEETTRISGENITGGISSYEFFTPLMEGDAAVVVNLTTDTGIHTATSWMRLYPYVRITNVMRVIGETEVFRVHIGVDAAFGPTSVFYGISRGLQTDWGDEMWVVPPTGLVAPGYGPLTFDLDLSGIGGMVYLRVCNFPGAVETYHLFDLDLDVHVSVPVPRLEGELLTIGPSLIHMRWDGMTAITPSDYSITYTVDIRNTRTNGTDTHELIWLSVDQMSAADRDALLETARSIGIPEEDVQGGWIGIRGVPQDDGIYSIRPHVTGDIIDGRPFTLGGFDMQLGAINAFTVGGSEDVDDDEGDERQFPTNLAIFVVAVIAGVFVLSILRKDAHLSSDEGEEPAEERGRRRRIPTRPELARGENVRRRAPPWKGDGFK
ncbi:MAG: M14 family zinc carboxypeptidase [Thermoplasmatota archaeon]